MIPLVWVMAALTQAPTIESVLPSPLPLAATAEITGQGFVPSATSVKIADVAQQVFQVEPNRVRFIVALDTPLGAQTLTLTAQGEAGGSVTASVEVVPAAPKINDVQPDPVMLGRLATVRGEGLATVVSATLGGGNCEITEQTDALLVFAVPFSADLVGGAELRLESASGVAVREVVVAAPAPEIDVLAPNPVRAGSLFTVRGRIAPLQPKVAIAAVEVPVVAVREAGEHGGGEGVEIVALVPRTMAPKPYDVVVSTGGVSSAPAGPLVVEAAAGDAPEASGSYPVRVAAGGQVWVAGVHLDGIEEVIGGPAILACERKACRLRASGLPPGGPYPVALVGPSGAAAVELVVLDEAPIVPVVTGVEPSPAIRGRTLTIRGELLAGVRSVVIGGVAQSIDFVDVDRIDITVDAATSLGAETLFVAGNTGSEPLVVTVLDPLPEGTEAGPEGVEPGPEIVEAVAEPAPGGGDEGCGGGGSVPWWGALVIAAGRFVSARRRLLISQAQPPGSPGAHAGAASGVSSGRSAQA